MVLNCFVTGCTAKTSKGEKVSFHHFPYKDLERCKQWLRAINHPKFWRGHQHGKPDKPEGLQSPFQTARLQTKCTSNVENHSKGHCNSIFTFPDDKQPGPSGCKRICLESPITSNPVVSSSEDEEQLPMTSTPVKIPASVQEQLSTGLSTPGGLNTSVSSIEAVGETDESYHPESTITPSSTSTTSLDDDGGKDWREKKIIVNESSLMSLFKFCQMCGKPISSKKIVDSGAQKKVDWTCLGGHSGTWTSSRDINGNARGEPPCNRSCSVQGGGHIHRTLRLVQNHGCPNDGTDYIL